MRQAQSVYVSVAHRYWNTSWTPEKNREVYGALASVEGVGSNFRLEAVVDFAGPGEFDFAPHLADLKAAVDHRCLFVDEARFQAAPSTTETVGRFLAETLFARPGPWVEFVIEESPEAACAFRPGALDAIEWRVRVMNLRFTVERSLDSVSGLALARGELERAARKLGPRFAEPTGESPEAWAESLMNAFSLEVNGLSSLRIDLGSQRFLQVSSQS